MTSRPGPPVTRGFTLIELMVSVAIVGLLSSVALPVFTKAQLRARAAERDTIMEAIARAVNDVVNQQQRVPGNTWSGVPNPLGTPSTTKRKFDWTAAGWTQLPMVVAGDAYYSYSFRAEDLAGDGKNVTLIVSADGDLDGDGLHSVRIVTFTGVGYSFKQDDEPYLDPNTF